MFITSPIWNVIPVGKSIFIYRSAEFTYHTFDISVVEPKVVFVNVPEEIKNLLSSPCLSNRNSSLVALRFERMSAAHASPPSINAAARAIVFKNVVFSFIVVLFVSYTFVYIDS